MQLPGLNIITYTELISLTKTETTGHVTPKQIDRDVISRPKN